MSNYVSRFIVDEEMGARGVVLHSIENGIATFSYFLPLAGREYRLGGSLAEYRAVQEKHHQTPAETLYETYEDARQAARELAARR